MTTEVEERDIADVVASAVPFLRRYARALTGSQKLGDTYAAAALETIISDPAALSDDDIDPRVAFFRVFNSVWHSDGTPTGQGADGPRAKGYAHLDKLTPKSREALLLQSIEEFTHAQIGEILGISADDAGQLIRISFEEMEQAIKGKVLIIEDEAIIAIDLDTMVSEIGHEVTGIARTHEGALRLGDQDKPDLILADIHLADGSSGIDAVNDLLADLGDTPVIFITAFPERLLTGKKPEPAFLITKPYNEAQVRAAISQAMFFSSTETLKN